MNTALIRYLGALLMGCVVSVSWSDQDSNENAQFKQMTEGQIRSKLEEQRALKGSGQENRGLIRKYRLELAKHGDKAERRSLFAELKSKDMAVQSRALEDVAQLGDKEAIARLGAMLDHPSEGGRYTRDQAFLPPRMVAAMKLANMIENPPVAPIGTEKKFYTEEDIKKWQKWWEENKKQYSTETMEPERAMEILQRLADGVDPYSGERLPSSSPYQQADTVRALQLALDGLAELKVSMTRATGSE